MPQRKRHWRPYEDARAYIQTLGLKNQKDYEAWSQSGQRPDDIPGSPSKAYSPFPGWGDFLGTGRGTPQRLCQSGQYRPFPEARDFVRQLGLGSQREYGEWAKSGERPGDIPANPYNAYRGEWTNWTDWLGLRGADGYRPFAEARAYARSLQLTKREEWLAHTRSPEFPADIPLYPEYGYRDAGWLDWCDWLGIEGKLTRPRILAILTSLVGVLEHLRPAELYAILLHKKVLTVDPRHTRIKALRALERLCSTDDVDGAIAEAAEALGSPAAENADAPATEPDAQSEESEVSPDELQRLTDIPRLLSLDTLRAVDRVVES